MQVLIVTADSASADALAGELRAHPQGVGLEQASSTSAALDRLDQPGVDAVVVHLAHLDPSDGLRLIEQVRRQQPALPLVVLIAAGQEAPLDVVAAGADGFVRHDAGAAAALIDVLRASSGRLQSRTRTPLRGLCVTRSEPPRDPSLAALIAFQSITPAPGAQALPYPYASGPLAFDAIVVDLSGGAGDLLPVVQDLVLRGAGAPVTVLTDAGDRRLAAAALRLGAHHVVAKAGAWPVHLGAAVEQAVAGRRARLETAVVRSSEARLRLLVESLPVGVTVIGRDGTILAMNAAGLEVAGASRPDEIVRMKMADCVAPDDREAVRAFVEAVSDGARQTIRARWLIGDRLVELSGVPLERSAAGLRAALTALRTVGRDEAAARPPAQAPPVHAVPGLPDRTKELEREVTGLRDALALAVREAEEARRARDAETRAEIARLKAKAHEAEMARGAEAEAHRLEVEHVRARVAQSYENELTTLGDELARARAALHERDAAQAALERRHREALEAAERESRRLGEEQAAEATLRQDAETLRQDAEALRHRLAEAEAAHEASLAARREEIETLCGAVDAAERARSTLVGEHQAQLEALRNAFREREAAQVSSKAALESEITSLRTQLDAALLQSESGMAAWRQRLDEVEARERRAFENELVGIAVTAADGTLVRANHAFERLFGDKAADVLRRLPEQWVRATRSIDTLAPLATEGRLPVTEGMITLGDGRALWYLEAAVIVPEADRERSLIERWFVDVTARHELTAVQRERRGVEAIGRVANDFVREIDALLAEVRRLAGQAVEQLDSRDPRHTTLRDTLLRAARAHEVSQQFLAFSRSHAARPDWLPLRATLESLEPLLRQLTGEGIRLDIEPPPDPLRVSATRDIVARVVIPLAASAADALPVGGAIAIRASGPAARDDGQEGLAARLAISARGFGSLPLREPPGLDALLHMWGATLRVTRDDQGQAFELTWPAIENGRLPQVVSAPSNSEPSRID